MYLHNNNKKKDNCWSFSYGIPKLYLYIFLVLFHIKDASNEFLSDHIHKTSETLNIISHTHYLQPLLRFNNELRFSCYSYSQSRIIILGFRSLLAIREQSQDLIDMISLLDLQKGNIQSHYRHCQLARALLILRSKAFSRYMYIMLIRHESKINSSHQTLCIAQFTKKSNHDLRNSINDITCTVLNEHKIWIFRRNIILNQCIQRKYVRLRLESVTVWLECLESDKVQCCQLIIRSNPTKETCRGSDKLQSTLATKKQPINKNKVWYNTCT